MAHPGLPGGVGGPCALLRVALAGWTPRASPASPPYVTPETTMFAVPTTRPSPHGRFSIKHGRFPIKNGRFPIKHGRLPTNHGNLFPINHGRFPIYHGRLIPIKHGRFPIKHGHLFAIKHGRFPSNQVRRHPRAPRVGPTRADRQGPRAASGLRVGGWHGGGQGGAGGGGAAAARAPEAIFRGAHPAAIGCFLSSTSTLFAL
jgi:hypothetical protein